MTPDQEIETQPDADDAGESQTQSEDQRKLEADRLAELSRDFDRLRAQKTRRFGGIEGRVLVAICMVNGEQYINYQNSTLSADPRDDNKLQLVFNVIGPRMGKLIGRISSAGDTYKASADKDDPQAIADAEVVDRLIKALDHVLVEPSKKWERLWWMMVGGVAFEHVPWVPNVKVELQLATDENGDQLYTHTDGNSYPPDMVSLMTENGLAKPDDFTEATETVTQGEVGSEILGPLNVFIDQSVKSIAELAPDQRVYIAKIRTAGWIKENFGVEIEDQSPMSIVSTRFNQVEGSVGGAFLQDLIPLIQGTNEEGQPSCALVVEGYEPPSTEKPSGWYDCFIPGQQILHSEACPYGEVPIVDFHWKPVTTTFWSHDYVTDLIPAQKFINKRLSQLGEQSNAVLYSQLLLGQGMTKEDIPTDYPGAINNGLDENSNPRVRRLEPPNLPAWFLESINTVMRTFNDLAGGVDLMQDSKFPGQMRGPMAVPMMQEIIDTEWGPLYEHLGERTALVKQMRVNRVKQFYPEERTMNYLSPTMKDEVLQFHTEKILRSGTNYSISIERGSLLPELRALREARVMERLNSPLSILYIDERTGRFDKSKIAADLAFGDTGRESREAQYRKLGGQIVGMLWTGQPVPPVLPFYDHTIMMDELEAAMATTEFLKADPQIQQAFSARWENHRMFMMMEAQAQQQGMAAAASHQAVAQATQQAAAQAAAEAVHQAMGVSQAAKEQPTEKFVSNAQAQAGNQPNPPGRPAPGGGRPSPIPSRSPR